MFYAIVIIPTDRHDWNFANVTLSAPLGTNTTASESQIFMIENPLIYKDNPVEGE